MPATKKEDFYFGMMMCTGMVIMMTLYNLFRNDLFGTLSIPAIIMQFVVGFIIAFLLELFVVGPVAKKIAFSLPYDKSKKIWVILSLALCMVTGMVLCMSLYGLASAYLSNNLDGGSFISNYFSTVLNNFIFALPLQLIIIGPLVRYVFQTFVKGKMAGSLS